MLTGLEFTVAIELVLARLHEHDNKSTLMPHGTAAVLYSRSAPARQTAV
jgi:hypothetical protein